MGRGMQMVSVEDKRAKLQRERWQGERTMHWIKKTEEEKRVGRVWERGTRVEVGR